ncbi:hypothetical protein MTO96_016981 [Rhipicephalus appendiculatus]
MPLGNSHTISMTALCSMGQKDALKLKEEFKAHFRNISRIMDCVGCDKCRLWGKLQVQGLGTAMKIPFHGQVAPASREPKVPFDTVRDCIALQRFWQVRS